MASVLNLGMIDCRYILILVDNSLADNLLIFNVGSYHVGVDMSINDKKVTFNVGKLFIYDLTKFMLHVIF